MGRVAGIVGPARRTDLEEAMHKERKKGHVPKQRDRVFIGVQRYHHICCLTEPGKVCKGNQKVISVKLEYSNGGGA